MSDKVFVNRTVVAVVLAFVFWPIFKWLKKTKGFKKLADFIERKLNKNAKDINEKTVNEANTKRAIRLKFFGVFAFVAIPLPLTGVWTGTCLGLFIGLNKLQTILACSLGNLLAGVIMTIVSYFFADNTLIVFLIFLMLVVLFIVFEVIRHFVEKQKKNKLLAKTKTMKIKKFTTIKIWKQK